ncbi:MAG: hypothetical protein OXG44_19200 [Gammaproteobacteria bacterium]|nr:hypothetical protein [Gammaproteobacteria bacterium]
MPVAAEHRVEPDETVGMDPVLKADASFVEADTEAISNEGGSATGRH